LNRWTDWLVGALGQPQSWLIIAGNVLPLLGAIWLGWDASTLVVLYWIETAIIGFWVIIQILFGPAHAVPRFEGRNGTGSMGGATLSGRLFLSVFLVFHAGIFMFVHMMFLSALLPGAWNQHLGSPVSFLTGFVIQSGVWLPLLGLFLVRGTIAVSDIRNGTGGHHVIISFYARIVLMQLTIILGGFLALAVGGTFMLALLVLFKTMADLGAGSISGFIDESLERAKREAGAG
jgi:hypothetical protein